MHFKKFALRGLVVLAVAIALCILFAGTIRTLTTPKVRFAPVKSGKFESVTELTGKIAFPEEEEMTLTVPEGLSLTVAKVLVTPGQKVKKGEKLLTTAVTDAEKTLKSLQDEIDTARTALESWERKNGSIRLSANEQQWMNAYEAAREADRAEQAARLEVAACLADMGITGIPETLPDKADEKTKKAYAAWQEAREKQQAARETLAGWERYAIPEDTWTLLQQKKDNEKKLQDAEDQMMTILLLSRQTEVVTAPHAGYVVSVGVEKGSVYTGDGALLCITPEKKTPVIRAEIADTKQKIQKGAAVTIPSDSWGRVESKVIETGVTDTGHTYADIQITEDVIYALGQVSTMMKNDIKVRLSSKAQEATCLIPAAAVRGSGNERYVLVGETETSALAGNRIVVRKESVTVLAENATTVSVAEDLTRSKILYMEDRVINEGGTVMLYEE